MCSTDLKLAIRNLAAGETLNNVGVTKIQAALAMPYCHCLAGTRAAIRRLMLRAERLELRKYGLPSDVELVVCIAGTVGENVLSVVSRAPAAAYASSIAAAPVDPGVPLEGPS